MKNAREKCAQKKRWWNRPLLVIFNLQGMCCAFNKEDADKIFIDSKYTRILNKLETHEKIGAFDNTSDPLWYKDEPKSQAGRKLGLEVVIDAHTDLLTEFSISSDFQVSIFINSLRTNFSYECRFGSFIYVHVTREKLSK
jgi:hypothetical protein